MCCVASDPVKARVVVFVSALAMDGETSATTNPNALVMRIIPTQ